QDRVRKLYNAHVFSQLGYMEAYAASVQIIQQSFLTVDSQIPEVIEGILRRHGPFMHTVNHPTIYLLSYLATATLKSAGLIPADIEPPTDVEDWLSNLLIFPVFPPIAARLRISGSWTFLKPSKFGRDRTVDLDEYIDLSFRIYEQRRAEICGSPL